MCALSKSVLVILVLSVFYGCAFNGVQLGISIWLRSSKHTTTEVTNLTSIILVSVFTTLSLLVNPLAGFIADVFCTRFKILKFSVIMMGISMFHLAISQAVDFRITINESLRIVEDVLLILAGIFFFIAFPCFSSSVIQFGFDQLQDLPSRYLSLFVHLYVWAESVGKLLFQVCDVVIYSANDLLKKPSTYNSHTSIYNSLARGLLIAAFPAYLIALLTSFCCYRMKLITFNSDKIKFNPYKLIVKVVWFTIRHKRPISHPSAFVYSDREPPIRIDFAKKRFSGPFDNSDVEDVKTFGCVLKLLVTLIPVFLLDIPVSFNVFTLFTLHSGTASLFDANASLPSADWVIIGSGTLSCMITVIGIPLYVWVVFTAMKNRIPKIIHRLEVAIFLYILAVFSLLLIDFSGHLRLYWNNEPNVECMFTQEVPNHFQDNFEHMNLHWAVFILPIVLIGLAPQLVMAAALEFISAQSPHSMKGVVVGVLFAIRGLSQLLSALLLVPFALKFWGEGSLLRDPPVTSCEFGYFLLITVLGIVGLIWFVLSVRGYKYRVRDEPGFTQSEVEEIFDRQLTRRDQYNKYQPLKASWSINSQESSDSSYYGSIA